jgi:hypothetical protein
MKLTDQPMPRARDEGLVVRELPDETLVYDLERHRAHALNQTAAWVWRHCDGQTTVTELAQSLHRALGVPSEEEAVWLALRRLERVHLLRHKVIPPASGANSSRRALLRSLAMAGGLAIVTSVVAPEAAHAQTTCGAAACSDKCCRCTNGATKCTTDCGNDCNTFCMTNGGKSSCP